jgi:AAHS family 4-hydroxybenzoate transporter-like MFS transporter
LLGALSKRYKVINLLFANFVVGTFAMATIGMAVASSVPLPFVAIFFSGFCVVGGQSGVNALGAQCYPTAMRATGMGWASGIGRFGSVSEPLVGGAMLSLNFGVQSVFFAAALAGALSVVLVFLLGAGVKRHHDDPSDAVAPTPSH